MIFHPTMLILLPGIAFAIWAQVKVKSTYKKYSQIATRSGMTGADVARAILNSERIDLAQNPEEFPAGSACGLEAIPGNLSDHYDPRSRMLRLSEDIYHGQSVAALGIAAHEVGHAIQHARMYAPLTMRGYIYPVCGFGSKAAFPLIFIGLILSMPALLQLGILFFTLAVIFTVVTLPVEFNASSRALKSLASGGYLEEEELGGARQVLNAAALTYVAAAAMAILQLLQYVLLAGSRD